MGAPPHPACSLDDARRLLEAAEALLQAVLGATQERTRSGRAIDAHQVLTVRVAYAATEARAAREALALARRLREEGRLTPLLESTAVAATGELLSSLLYRLEPVLGELGMGADARDAHFPAALRETLHAANAEATLRHIGHDAIERGGRAEPPLDEMLEQVRDSVRAFAEKEVAPLAERIHRGDEDIPEALIRSMGELGYFGLSIPETYGGHELGNQAMLLTTEELSRASLAGAGSLITRPEILAKALLAGGTEEQKREWLPKLASGALMIGVSVTEPDVGSDVASLKCRAEKVAGGWRLQGPKAWCTFAGRADVLAVLARSEDVAGAKGLSLFIVPKDPFPGHSFEMRQAEGGRLVGSADATPGYRGMHSFTLNFENYFVPDNCLVGGEAGRGRGFALQMGGFAAGRLQTGGRACGLAQAALEETAKYVAGRAQFGKPIGDFQLTRYTLGHMAAQLFAARALSYAAANAMDEDERKAVVVAAQAKLLACDIAARVSQQGQVMHGGWGYAEEYPISRYVVDALVLPIFEGVKPILELKVIGRALLSG